MAENKRAQRLRETTVDEIKDWYKTRQINYGEYNKLLRDKAEVAFEDERQKLSELPKATWDHMIQIGQQHWDRLIELHQAAAKDSASPIMHQIGQGLLGTYHIAQLIMSPMTAATDIGEKQIHDQAIAAGASPGWANFLAGVGGFALSGAGPGLVAKGVAKAVGGVSEAARAAQKAQDVAGLIKDPQLLQMYVNALSREGAAIPNKLLEMLGRQVPTTAAAAASPEVPQVAAKAVEEAPRAVSTFPDEVAAFARNIKMEDARNKISGLANKLGINLDELKNIVPGGRLDPKNPWYENPKKMYGYLKALEGRVEQIAPMAKAALEGEAGAPERFGHYMMNLFAADPEAKAKVGQGLTKMLMHWDPENMASGNLSGALQTFAKDFAQLAEINPKGIGSMITEALKSQEGGMIPAQVFNGLKRLYFNALLPFSAGRIFVGNSIGTGAAVMERAAGAMFGTGATTSREALYMTKGLVLAQADGVKAIGDALRGLPVTSKIPYVGGSAWEFPINSVRAMDAYNRTIVQRASLYASAFRIAEQSGLTGSALGAEVRRLVMSPTSDMVRETSHLMDTATYQNELGKFGAMIMRARGNTQLGQLYFPFLKTAVNLGKWAWNRTPGLQLISGQLYQDIAAGGARADMAIGRIVTSQMMTHMVAEMAKDGYITGNGPQDYKLRKTWLMTHQPNSIKTPKGWMEIPEPMRMMTGAVSDMVDVMDKTPPEEAERVFSGIAFSAMHNFADNTWWRAANRLWEVAQGAEEGKYTQEMGRAVASPVFSGLSPVARVRRAIDPMQRETRTMVDAVQSQIPGYSKTLPPVRDGLGDPVVPPQDFAGSWFGLLNPNVPSFRPYEQDPLKKLLSKLEVETPAFGDSIGGRVNNPMDSVQPRPTDKQGLPINPKQRDELIQIYREMVRHPEYGLENSVVNNPDIDWDVMSREGQRAQIEHALEVYKLQAEKAFLVKHPDMQQKLAEQQGQRQLSRMADPSMREETQAEISNAVGSIPEQSEDARQQLESWGIYREMPDTATYGTPYGPLTITRPVPTGTPGAVKVPPAPIQPKGEMSVGGAQP